MSHADTEELIKVAKITLWDGAVFYTDDEASLQPFIRRAAKKHTGDGEGRVDIVEMTRAEYQAIPATVEFSEFFSP